VEAKATLIELRINIAATSNLHLNANFVAPRRSNGLSSPSYDRQHAGPDWRRNQLWSLMHANIISDFHRRMFGTISHCRSPVPGVL